MLSKSYRRQMPPTNKLWRAKPTVADIWDRTQKKLVVQVLEVDESIAQEKLYCTLRLGKTEQKSHKLKGGQCNEYFFFSLDEGGDIVIEFSRCLALRRTEFAGEAFLANPIKEHEEEQVVDMWLPLQARAGKKDKVHGKVHIRFLYSCSPETKGTEDRGQQIFFYDDYIDSFKTGDLIIYSGIGALHSMTKLATNSPYSHLGMIFRLPNKWTRRDDLFVLEVVKNNDGFLDAFLERPHAGVALFRLFERIHQYQGTKIWWAPLQANIPIDTQKLIDRMWNVHEENVDFLQPRIAGRKPTEKAFFTLDTDLFSEVQNGAIAKDTAIWEPLSAYNITRSFQQKAEITDLLDTKLITLLFNAAGLKQQIAGGIKQMSSNQRLYPADVVKYECFGQPILLRDVDFTVQTEKSKLPQHFFIVQDHVAQAGLQPDVSVLPQMQPQGVMSPQVTPPQTPIQPQPVVYDQSQAMMAAATLRPGHFYPPQHYGQPVLTPPQTPPQGQPMYGATMYGYAPSQAPAAYIPPYQASVYSSSPQAGHLSGTHPTVAMHYPGVADSASAPPLYPSPGSNNPPPFNPEYAQGMRRLSQG